MHQMQIVLGSFQQVQEFVSLAASQPFNVIVGNDGQAIDGKDLMGMFSLDYTQPVLVSAECQEDDFLLFRQQAAKFLV